MGEYHGEKREKQGNRRLCRILSKDELAGILQLLHKRLQKLDDLCRTHMQEEVRDYKKYMHDICNWLQMCKKIFSPALDAWRIIC